MSECGSDIVDLLHRQAIAGATVFLGVDGMTHGLRQRAGFFSRNTNVPLMIISVGAGPIIADVPPKLGSLLERPLLTLERVRVLKRDGQRLTDPAHLTDDPAVQEGDWQKLMIYAGEQARLDGHPLYVELIRRLRQANAAGATALRGIWGYHAPHGDRLLSLRRHVPVVTVIVDRREEIQRIWPIVDEATASTGLVTSELVPAYRAERAPERQRAFALPLHRRSHG